MSSHTRSEPVVSLSLSFLALGPAAPHPFRDALARRGGQLTATLATAHGLRRRRRRAYLLAQLVRLGCQRREAFSRLRDFALQAAKRPPDELGGFQEHISAGPAGSSTSHGRSPCQERGRLRVAPADDESQPPSRSLEESTLGTFPSASGSGVTIVRRVVAGSFVQRKQPPDGQSRAPARGCYHVTWSRARRVLRLPRC